MKETLELAAALVVISVVVVSLDRLIEFFERVVVRKRRSGKKDKNIRRGGP